MTEEITKDLSSPIGTKSWSVSYSFLFGATGKIRNSLPEGGPGSPTHPLMGQNSYDSSGVLKCSLSKSTTI